MCLFGCRVAMSRLPIHYAGATALRKDPVVDTLGRRLPLAPGTLRLFPREPPGHRAKIRPCLRAVFGWQGGALAPPQKARRQDPRRLAEAFVGRQARRISAVDMGTLPSDRRTRGRAHGGGCGKKKPRPYAANLPNTGSRCPRKLATNTALDMGVAEPPAAIRWLLVRVPGHPAILRAEMCATCARNELPDSCLGRRHPSAQRGHVLSGA
jgi:hypothetical protein